MSSFDEDVRDVQRDLRRYQRDSILFQALHSLRRPAPDRLAALQELPWITALIVKWTCIGGAMPRRDKPSIDVAQFNDLRQRVWTLTDHLSIDDAGGRNWDLLFRQITNVQNPFQRALGKAFVFDAVLIGSQPATHRLRRLFKDGIGMSEQAFIDLSLLCQTMIQKGYPDVTVPQLREFAPAYSSTIIDAFVSLVSRDCNQLTTYVRSLKDSTRRVQSELVEFPAIARYPYLRDGQTLRSWHPMIFHKGISELVHMTLARSGGAYIEPFGEIFEAHVTALASAVGGQWIPESELRTYLPGSAEVPDGLLSFPDCNIFVESKSGLYPQEVVTVGSREIATHKVRSIKKAFSQAWSASDGLRHEASAPPQVLAADSEFLIVVTNRELGIGTGDRLDRIFPEGKLVVPVSDAGRRLTFPRMFVVSIDNYDWMMEAARTERLHLPDFLERCRTRNENPETSTYFMEQQLGEEGLAQMSSPLISKAVSAGFGRIRDAVVRSVAEVE